MFGKDGQPVLVAQLATCGCFAFFNVDGHGFEAAHVADGVANDLLGDAFFFGFGGHVVFEGPQFGFGDAEFFGSRGVHVFAEGNHFFVRAGVLLVEFPDARRNGYYLPVVGFAGGGIGVRHFIDRWERGKFLQQGFDGGGFAGGDCFVPCSGSGAEFLQFVGRGGALDRFVAIAVPVVIVVGLRLIFRNVGAFADADSVFHFLLQLFHKALAVSRGGEAAG
ncbi:hypothetical protein [Parabacteroides goldsteinii]|uniref:hypothetical protein n=1 Tax=Parabacteroides goldsteinii TaxID=328812 RepID=UPI0002FEC571|nr:hypothetical protein [Parabacteroides goldsteinii]